MGLAWAPKGQVALGGLAPKDLYGPIKKVVSISPRNINIITNSEATRPEYYHTHVYEFKACFQTKLCQTNSCCRLWWQFCEALVKLKATQVPWKKTGPFLSKFSGVSGGSRKNQKESRRTREA